MMGGRLGVKVEVDSNPTSSLVTLRATPAGPWAIVEYGTKAYDIVPRRAEVLATGGDIIGTKAHRQRRAGKRYWDAATSRLGSTLDQTVEDAVADEMGAI